MPPTTAPAAPPTTAPTGPPTTAPPTAPVAAPAAAPLFCAMAAPVSMAVANTLAAMRDVFMIWLLEGRPARPACRRVNAKQMREFRFNKKKSRFRGSSLSVQEMHNHETAADQHDGDSDPQ